MKIKSLSYLLLAAASSVALAEEPAPVPPAGQAYDQSTSSNAGDRDVAQASVQPTVRTEASTNKQSPTIRQTRFQEEESRTEKRKPGLFRRMFGAFAEKDSKKIPDGVGAPPPKIPAPPRLTYSTQGPGIGQRQKGVPTKNVSYARKPTEQPDARFAPTSGSTAYDIIPEIITSPQSMAPRAASSQFVDPFANQPEADEPDFLLNLDAMAPQTQSAPVVPKAPAKAIREVTLEPALKRPADQATGFLLEDGVLDLDSMQKVETPKAAVQLISPARIVPEVRAAAIQPVIEPKPEPAPTFEKEERFSEIPLLVEPEMHQPTQPTAQRQPKTPSQVVAVPKSHNLQVSDSGLISTDTAEEFSTPDPAAAVVPVSPNPTGVTQPPRKSHATQARRSQQMYRIMSRTGKTGFKGFCPVALRDQRELIDAHSNLRARFGLATYYFSSSAAKARFEADPTRYAPAAGGSDVVLLVNTGEEEIGSLDFSLWYRDRLYLFRSRETRALFSKNPTRFANQY